MSKTDWVISVAWVVLTAMLYSLRMGLERIEQELKAIRKHLEK